MKKLTLLIFLFVFNSCASPSPKNSEISLDDAEWVPVNTNYMNKKDF